MGYVDIGEMIFLALLVIGSMGGFFYAIKNDKL